MAKKETMKEAIAKLDAHLRNGGTHAEFIRPNCPTNADLRRRLIRKVVPESLK